MYLITGKFLKDIVTTSDYNANYNACKTRNLSITSPGEYTWKSDTEYKVGDIIFSTYDNPIIVNSCIASSPNVKSYKGFNLKDLVVHQVVYKTPCDNKVKISSNKPQDLDIDKPYLNTLNSIEDKEVTITITKKMIDNKVTIKVSDNKQITICFE